MLLGPTRVHAQQHLRPILALGSSGPGVDLKEAIIGVRFPGQQCLRFPTPGFGPQRRNRRFSLRDDRGIILGIAELEQGEMVVELLLDVGNRGETVLERGALLHQALRAVLIVPEVRILRLPVEVGQARLRAIEVKDASGAGPPTAGCR